MAAKTSPPRSSAWLGVLSRNRADFAAERSMIASAQVGINPGGYEVASLANNDPQGRTIAVLAVLAWMLASPQLAAAYIVTGGQYPQGWPVQPLYTGMEPIAGLLTSGGDPRIQTASPAFMLRADGARWLERARAPLALITPGYALEIGQLAPGGIEAPNEQWLSCSFTWCYWGSR